ncbi:hypothetical protein TKWG_18395 [Advenella kashmirensis WT001]|uniref:Uncharacterized protein n=1 Tax=Advenella kashmirensis (strain DSM 17095 / LMG 22695 / WT001) TaxID=1036672 RepID=I3UEV5_ADVKW|nr:hypothetical protein [Advenella kashmirensis]AFK63543.1 hypothetical protein TKWG_18395 [Advenella kashmirensis WT001]
MKITHVLTGAIGCLLAVAAQSALAKIPVYVFGNTPNDPIGTYITAQIRNQIANSPTLTLVNDMNRAVARLNLQSADPTREADLPPSRKMWTSSTPLRPSIPGSISSSTSVSACQNRAAAAPPPL